MIMLSPVVRRRLLGGLIVGFWLVMLGVLVGRQLKGRGIVGHGSAPTTVPRSGERWLAISTGGKRIGTLHVATTPATYEGRAGAALRLDAELHVRVLETPTELRVVGRLWHAVGDGDGTVDLDVTSGVHAVHVEGAVHDGILRGTVRTAGTSIPLHARVGTLPTDEESLLGLMPGAGLELGKEVSFQTIDPFTLRPAPAHARCVREETLTVGGRRVATRLVEVKVGTTTLTAWLDAAGEVVQADVPFGIRLRRISREEADTPLDAHELPDLLATLNVAPTGIRPRRGAHRIVVAVIGVPARMLPADDTQTLAADGMSLIVAAPTVADARPIGAPDNARSGTAAYLACNALVQCDQPAIRELAASIVRGETHPWARALLLERWVNRNLAKHPVPALPSALDVLSTREGDCTEHTVLFTALARAVGLPTRMAAGLVWSEEVDAFAYHAWPEVYVGRWVWTDPTLGQPVADATHIKLATGGIEDWRGVAAFLGRVRLEVKEIE
jgi:hypothetical protein